MNLSLYRFPIIVMLIICLFCTNAFSQDDTSTIKKPIHTEFFDYRGTNSFDAAVGTAVINGDLNDPKFDAFFHVGYKRFFAPFININFSYNKFNLSYKDVYNEGFMSFDLNLESILFPHHKFSPFVFVGGGYNASNYFKQTATKLQGGGGLEYMVANGFGLKLYTDYNYVFSDELDGVIAGNSDDTYFRIALGVNYYFGGAKMKEKRLKDQPTTIKSNPIIERN